MSSYEFRANVLISTYRYQLTCGTAKFVMRRLSAAGPGGDARRWVDAQSRPDRGGVRAAPTRRPRRMRRHGRRPARSRLAAGTARLVPSAQCPARTPRVDPPPRRLQM